MLLEKQRHMKWASQIYIHEIVVILRERAFDIAVKNEPRTVDEDVKTTKFLNNRESHFVLLEINTEITLDHERLGGERFTYLLQGSDVAAY